MDINPYNLGPLIDTTGAGDAFTAGLINQLLRVLFHPATYKEAEAVIEFAAACGGLVCTGAGAIDPQPTYKEVLQCLSITSGGDK